MAFQYRARSRETVEKRAEQQGGDREGFISDEFRIYQPRKGDNWIRILPPTWDEPEHFGMDCWVHYGIGPDRAALICTAKQPHPTTGEKGACAICEARVRAEKAGDNELADELKPSRRVLVWVLDRKEEEKGALIWAMPWTVDRDICKISRDKRSGEMFIIDHPDEGYDVMFDKEGEQLTTKYVGMQIARQPSSVDQDILDYIEGAPLPFTLRWREYDEVLELFKGSGMEENGSSRRDDRGSRDRDPPRRETSRDRDPPRRETTSREDRRDPPPREERDPPRRETSRDRDPPPREDRARQDTDEDIRHAADNGGGYAADRGREREAPPQRRPTNGDGRAAEREPEKEKEPPFDRDPPRRDPPREEPARSSDAASRAEQLRARFANKK